MCGLGVYVERAPQTHSDSPGDCVCMCPYPLTSLIEGGGPQASPQSPVGLCSRAASTALLPAGTECPDSPDDRRTVPRLGSMLRDMDTHIVPALKMRLENVHHHKRQREERESVPDVHGVHRAGGPCVGGPARRELSRSAC